MKKAKRTSDEPEENCELRLDFCHPESLPIPSKDDGSIQEKIWITGRFAANVPIKALIFATKVTEDDEEEFEEDTCFVTDGAVRRVQFNQIMVPVKISPKAAPGPRYFTVTQGETENGHDDCTVANVDLAFKLT